MALTTEYIRSTPLTTFFQMWERGANRRHMAEAVNDIIDALHSEAQRRAPVRTGQLREQGIRKENVSIISRGSDEGTTSRGRFVPFDGGRATFSGKVWLGPLPSPGAFQKRQWYPLFVHEGSGVFAGRGLIRPVSAPYLVFEIDGRKFRRRTVKGQRAQPFMREALAAMHAGYIPGRVRVLASELST